MVKKPGLNRVKPKSLNDNVETSFCFDKFGQIFSCSGDKNFQVNYNARWILNLLLHTDLGLTSRIS